MKTIYTWKKGLFSDTYNIFDKNKQIGYIKNNSFSRKSTAEIYNTKILFQDTGVFENETLIVDVSTNKTIGKIKYRYWRNKADIDVNNEIFKWEYRNFWNTKWDIYNSRGLHISYESILNNGWIETNELDTMKLLLGLYVNQYYERINSYIAVFCCFIPIITLFAIV